MSSLFGRVATPGTPATQPGGGLFGASTTPANPPTGGLFGSATPAAPAGGLFGSTPAINTTGGGLFGGASAAPAATAPSTGGGLFGAPTPAATSAPAAGGFFGATTTTVPPAGGLFGAVPATTTAAAPATGGGMFGAAPAPATGGGLFGGATAAPATKPSLFGATPTLNTGAPASGGLFGAAPATSGGMFSATPPAPSTGFGATIGGAQQAVPAATIDSSKLTSTTRFGDCHPTVQQSLEEIEKEIQSQISMSCQLADKFPSHREALESIPVDASVLTHRLATTKSFQMSDQAAYDQVRANHDADDQASTLSIRTLDLFRLPHAQRSQYIQRTSTYSTPQRENDVTGNKPMIAYFNKQADEMERKMDMISRTVRQVEDSLISVESQAIQGARGAHVDGRDLTSVTGGVPGRQDARRLNSALREFNDALRGVSGRIVDAREGFEGLSGRR